VHPGAPDNEEEQQNPDSNVTVESSRVNVLLSGDIRGCCELAAFGTFPVRKCARERSHAMTRTYFSMRYPLLHYRCVA
jgi:hypothetical protein